MNRIDNLHASPLPGGGPWRILDECPADRHNTLYAAVKGGRRGPGNARCICPRALWRKQDDLDSRRGEHARWYQENKARLKAAKVVDQPALKVKHVRVAPVPDMTDAACGSDDGQVAVDIATAEASAGNLARVAAFCNSPCPIKEQCLRWVMSAEDRPGSWGGVYGGLTPKQRRDLAAKQRKEVA